MVNNLLEIRPDDFKDIRDELQREGKDDKIEIKNINVFTAPGKWWRQRWNVRYRFNIKHLFIDGLIAITILLAIVANIFYWIGGSHYFVDKLNVNVYSQSQEIKSAGLTSFVIEYTNDNPFDLQLASLAVKLPKNFNFQDVSRTDYDREKNILFLGDLAPGANGKLTITGRVLGNVNEKQSIYTTFSYYKTNKYGARLWGKFNTNKQFEYSFAGSEFKTSWLAPTQAIAGENFAMQFGLINVAENFDEVYWQVFPANNLKVIDGGESYLDGVWRKYGVTPEEKVTIDSTWQVTGSDLTVPLKLSFYVKYNGEYYLQWQEEKTLVIYNPGLKFTAALTESSIQPGQNLTLNLKFENTGSNNIENISLLLPEDNNVGQWLTASSRQPVIKDGNIIFNNLDFPWFDLLTPGEKREITLALKTNSSFSSADNQISITPKINFEINKNALSLTAAPALAVLENNLGLKSSVRYYSPEGDQLGRGPIPPQVGQTTKYWIFMQVTNDVRDMNDVRLSANLAANVVWTNQTSVTIGKNINYDAATKTVSWALSKVKVNPANISLAFELGLTPSADQRGDVVNLLENITISGTDALTGKRVTHALSDLTTELPISDKIPKGNGVVW